MTATTDAAAPSLLRRAIVGTRTTGAERVCFALLALLLVVGATANDWDVFYPDNKPEIYLAPERTVAKSLSTWQPSPKQAGLPSFDVGVAPVAAVSWVLRDIGLEPWLVVRVWRAALLLIAALGAVRLLDRLSDNRPHAAGRVAIAAVYTINPYVVLQGTTTAVLLPYALLPWLVVALDRALDEPRRWRWPAITALVFFAMSGINAGVIPILLVALVVPVLVAQRLLLRSTSWPAIAHALGRCALLAGGVSLYWFVPSALAAATGAAIAGATEPTDSIAYTTSFAESIRLTGLWTLYGRSGDRLFSPQYSVYLTNAVVVLAAFALPIAAALSAALCRGRVRLLAVMLLALGIPVMAGIFPPADRTPFGGMLGWAFDHVPGLIAFRTTNKAAPVVALALALLVAQGAAAASKWLRLRPPLLQGAGAATAVLILAAGTFPTWSGNLYRQELDPPEHWLALAADLDAHDDRSRVLVVPGGSGANYRWGMRSPDDIFNSIMDREVIARSTVFPPHNAAANLIAHLDTAFGEQSLEPGSLSTIARHLGASEVVARNDYRWEEVRAARPLAVMNGLRADPGLSELGTYGPPGVYTIQPTDDGAEPTDLEVGERSIEALARFAVKDPLPSTRAVSLSNAVLLVGDGEAMTRLAPLGLLDDAPAVRYAGELESHEAGLLLDLGATVVLTDTNRRRTGGISRTQNVWSETLTAGHALDNAAGPSPTLWPDDLTRQTVSRLIGATELQTSPAAFGTRAAAKPAFAFDDDPTTRWVTGHLGTGRGQWIEVTFDEPIELSTFDLLPFGDSEMHITEILVTTDHTASRFALSSMQEMRATLPTGMTQRLRIEITDLVGVSPRGVGFREITIPGVEIRDVAVLPRDLDRLAEDAEVARRLATAPLEVLLRRQRALPGVAFDDEERRLDRDFSLPVQRSFAVSGTLTGADQIPTEVLQQVFTGFADGATLDRDVCFTIGFFDDQPIDARLDGTFWNLLYGEEVHLVACRDDPLRLAAGTHAFRSAPGWVIDSLRFSTTDATTMTTTVPSPQVSVLHSDATSLTVDVSASDTPYYLTTGRGWDPRWKATADGTALGPPLLIDGYAAAWLIEDSSALRVEITYGPQAWLAPSILASLLVLVLCVSLAVRRERAS